MIIPVSTCLQQQDINTFSFDYKVKSISKKTKLVKCDCQSSI